MPSVIRATGLTKTYSKEKRAAVDQLSFSLEEGEILGLLGANGSGKTTTIQMLLGTLAVSSGAIEYFGLNFFHHRSKILEQVAYASAYTSLPYLLTIAENLRCFAQFYGIRDWDQKMDPLLERFGILEKKHHPISSLSAGQITRLMLVKVFFVQPKVVLLDEPTASLDPEMSFDVCEFLLEQREKTGLSILFTSHKMQEVSDLCDRIIFLKEGKLIADDLPKNLVKKVSLHKVSLTLTEGMEKITALAEERSIAYQCEHRTIHLSLDEKEIPPFLNGLVHAGVSYVAIRIKEPSLEDYFLQLTGKR